MKKVVFRSKYLTVEEERVGKRGKTILIERKGDVVFVVPKLPSGKLLMERHYRPQIKKYLYEFPAGYVNKNETPIRAAARELEEETGYVAGKIKPLISVYWSAGWGPQKGHFFYASDLRKGRRRLEPGEILEAKEMRVNDVNRMIANGKIADSATALAFLYYVAYVQNE
jgi:ADP-ribose pyrophosphatase